MMHPLGGSKHFFVPGHHRQGEVLGTSGGQNGHGRLGAHAVDRGQQLIAPLLLPADEAVQVIGILPDGFTDIEPGRLIQLQLSGGIGGNTAAVAHAAAVDDRQARLQKGYIAADIINHRKTSFFRKESGKL